MINSNFLSVNHIYSLVQKADDEIKHLYRLYDKIPPVECKRSALCCSLLPDMTLLEALSAIKTLREMPFEKRKKITESIIRYFFLNPVKLTGCPFLSENECLIYENRFLGCRAYGVWTPSHYEKISFESKKSRKNLKDQWKKAGVNLPREILEFQVPYCKNVKILKKKKGGFDKSLKKIAREVSEMSNMTDPSLHAGFHQKFFSDLSFLTTAMILGQKRSVELKFQFVKECVEKNSFKKLDELLYTINTPF